MKIKNEIHAKEIAAEYLGHKTLVVSESGDIYAGCNVAEVCKTHEDKNQKVYILKGEKESNEKETKK